MEIKIKSFNEFSLDELYQVLQLRSEVFVVEQDCVYQDIDGKDQKALHILGFRNRELIAYSRCFDQGNYFEEASIGRVIVKWNERKFSHGHELLKASIEVIQSRFNTTKIKISAQKYLTRFYESHEFQQIGEGYLEDGIPHILMIRG